jgi:hypothetical protein
MLGAQGSAAWTLGWAKLGIALPLDGRPTWLAVPKRPCLGRRS